MIDSSFSFRAECWLDLRSADAFEVVRLTDGVIIVKRV